MTNQIPPPVCEFTILEILTRARHHELCRQINEGFECLKPVWEDVSSRPRLAGYSPPVQGEILLRCGALLSYYSFHQQVKELNETARDWLTEAANIFKKISNKEKIGETELETGISYWREGAFEEAKVCFASAAENLTNPFSSARIKLNGLILLNTYSLSRATSDPQKTVEALQYAYNFIEQFDMHAKHSDDSRAKIIWYINSAVIMVELEKFGNASERYIYAIECCREVGNDIHRAIAENNLAGVYRDLKDFDNALLHIDRSMAIFQQLGDLGGVAGCFDTKAQIYLAMKEPKKAFRCSNKALKLYRDGEAYAAFVEALWTKAQALLQLGETVETLTIFAEIYEIACTRISKAAAERYAADLSKLVFIRSSNDLAAEGKKFEAQMIAEALKKCGGLITPAAEYLGLSHQTLSRKIDVHHPQLKPDFSSGRKRRRARGGTRSSPVASANNYLKVNIPNHIKPDAFFEITSTNLSYLGLIPGVFAVISNKLDFSARLPYLLKDLRYKTFHAGFLNDEFAGFYAVTYGIGSDPVPFSVNFTKVIGQIVGFCRAKINGDGYEFIELEG